MNWTLRWLNNYPSKLNKKRDVGVSPQLAQKYNKKKFIRNTVWINIKIRSEIYIKIKKEKNIKDQIVYKDYQWPRTLILIHLNFRKNNWTKNLIIIHFLYIGNKMTRLFYKSLIFFSSSYNSIINFKIWNNAFKICNKTFKI